MCSATEQIIVPCRMARKSRRFLDEALSHQPTTSSHNSNTKFVGTVAPEKRPVSSAATLRGNLVLQDFRKSRMAGLALEFVLHRPGGLIHSIQFDDKSGNWYRACRTGIPPMRSTWGSTASQCTTAGDWDPARFVDAQSTVLCKKNTCDEVSRIKNNWSVGVQAIGNAPGPALSIVLRIIRLAYGDGMRPAPWR